MPSESHDLIHVEPSAGAPTDFGTGAAIRYEAPGESTVIMPFLPNFTDPLSNEAACITSRTM